MPREKKKAGEETKPTRIKRKNLKKVEQIQNRYGIDSKAKAIDFVFREFEKQTEPPEEWLKDEILSLSEEVDEENRDLKLLLAKFNQLITLSQKNHNVSEALDELIRGFKEMEEVE